MIWEPAELRFPDDRRILYTRRNGRGMKARFIGFQVVEFERIGRDEIFGILVETSFVGQHRDTVGSGDSKMMAALGTDLEQFAELLRLEDFSARTALHPKSFRDFRGAFRNLRLNARRL